MKKEFIECKVVDTETGNYCIYDGYFLENALEAIKDNAKVENEDAEDFTDAELFDLYQDGNRIWCGATGTIAELVNLCYPNPVLGKAVGDYLNAAFCWGSDPERIENTERAIDVFLMTNADGVECHEQEGEDREIAIEKLELSDEEEAKIYAFGAYNQERWLICFDEV